MLSSANGFLAKVDPSDPTRPDRTSHFKAVRLESAHHHLFELAVWSKSKWSHKQLTCYATKSVFWRPEGGSGSLSGRLWPKQIDSLVRCNRVANFRRVESLNTRDRSCTMVTFDALFPGRNPRWSITKMIQLIGCWVFFNQLILNLQINNPILNQQRYLVR